MKKFQYKVFNLSEVEKLNATRMNQLPYTWLDLLNEYGHKGWEVTGIQPSSQSYLLKRETIDSGDSDL